MPEIRPENERKTERVVLRVGPTMKKRLEESAKHDRRDVADWARLELERALGRKGRR